MLLSRSLCDRTVMRRDERHGIGPFPVIHRWGYRLHENAIDRTRRDTQLAPCALFGDHRVHLFGCTNDGIYRAGLQAQGTTDAGRFINDGYAFGFFHAMLGRKWLGFSSEKIGELTYTLFAARWAAVDIRATIGDSGSIGFAAWKTALSALGLRQNGINFIDKRITLSFKFDRDIAQQRTQDNSA
jgi:hypothetical protein